MADLVIHMINPTQMSEN